ncbi:MAG: carboxypeptidase-like regulatory domain-containing protein, partial [Acidobacteriota bacterium]
MKKNQFTYVKFFVLAFVLIGLMQANGLLAQSATILGTVQDETDAVLPGVSVTTTNLETNQSRTVISDD